MKQLLAILVLCVSILTSCGGIKTSSQGIANDAFLEFTGKPADYPDGVEVIVDNNPAFVAQVKKPNYRGFNKSIYAISRGTHVVVVNHNNKTIFKQKIFISINETKKIVLP